MLSPGPEKQNACYIEPLLHLMFKPVTESLVTFMWMNTQLATQVLQQLYEDLDCSAVFCACPVLACPSPTTVWYSECPDHHPSILTHADPLWFRYSTGAKGIRRSLDESPVELCGYSLRHQGESKDAFMGSVVLICTMLITCLMLVIRVNKKSWNLHHSSRSASPISTNDIWTGYWSSWYNVTICSGAWAWN